VCILRFASVSPNAVSERYRTRPPMLATEALDGSIIPQMWGWRIEMGIVPGVQLDVGGDGALVRGYLEWSLSGWEGSLDAPELLLNLWYNDPPRLGDGLVEPLLGLELEVAGEEYLEIVILRLNDMIEGLGLPSRLLRIEDTSDARREGE